MSDEIIKELWQVKDDIAREHNHDVRELARYLQGRSQAVRDQTVNGRSVKETAETDRPIESAIEGQP